MSVYLDNAATTQLDKEVFDAMTPYLLTHFGNPSSGHHYGREARAAVAKSRAIIAGLLNALPEEITFTSGGTEADNTAILSAVRANGIKNVITTRFEHHAVLKTLRELQNLSLDDVQNFYRQEDKVGTDGTTTDQGHPR